jgi:hypothetical protein
MIDILSAVVTLQKLDGMLKNGLNHGNQSAEMSKYFILMTHGVNPRVARKFIGKQNIVFKTTKRGG